MKRYSSRREFLRAFGLRASVLPFILNLPSLGFANQGYRKQRMVIMFSPNGTIPDAFWPDEEGSDFQLKEITQPLASFKDRMLMLRGVCDKIRGNGDEHMRGIGCLLTGIELFAGNISGGGKLPAGWASGLSIDQEIKSHLQESSHTRTRFGSLEFGVLVSERNDTWSRMVYAGPNRPVPPIDDPYQMFGKLYGRVKDSRIMASVLDQQHDTFRALAAHVSTEDRHLLEEHASFIRKMELDLHDAAQSGAIRKVTDLQADVKLESDSMPTISRLQVDLLVDSFVNDFTRIATLQYNRSISPTRMTWLGVSDAHHTLSHEPNSNAVAMEKLTSINRWFAEEMAYLCKRLAETPEPGGPGSLLDNTLVIWTNELGRGNTHSMNDIPFVLIGNGLNFKMGRSLRYNLVPHNRLLLSLAHGFDHHIDTFGNPDHCSDGPLSLS